MRHSLHACMIEHAQALSICKSYDLPFNLCCLSDVVWGSFYFNSENVVYRVGVVHETLVRALHLA